MVSPLPDLQGQYKTGECAGSVLLLLCLSSYIEYATLFIDRTGAAMRCASAAVLSL